MSYDDLEKCQLELSALTTKAAATGAFEAGEIGRDSQIKAYGDFEGAVKRELYSL